jgi:hypothetical protein
MLCVVATIAGIGVLLLSTKTIVQVFYHPVLVPNLEDPEGTTVCVHIHKINTCHIIPKLK